MKNFDEFITNLSKLISFNTTLAPAKDDAPFGEQTKNALNFFLSLASSFGFTVKNYDNYMGEVIFGEGKEIGIIGHLDVVPEGTGWLTPPYALTEKDGAYYGRGTSDDKAPTLLNLYALKELKDLGVKPNCKFRLFVGCNEETGWKDVEYVKDKISFPEYGFSPDGNFPLSYAEKGVLHVTFTLPKLKNFSGLKGGTVINAVCDLACANSALENLDPTLLAKYGLTTDGDKIISRGVTAHGAMPHLGKNAIKPLFEYFIEVGEDLQNVIDCLFNDKYNLSRFNNEQGALTFSPNLIEEKDGAIVISCDCRVPAPVEFKDVIKIIEKFNIPFTAVEKHPPVMVEKDGWFVTALLSAYNKVMNQNAKPEYMNGSSFARVFKKGCAFGGEFPGAIMHMHEPNERITKEEILTSYEIYKTALENLAKL